MDQLGALRADVRQVLIELAMTSVNARRRPRRPDQLERLRSRGPPQGEPSPAESYVALGAFALNAAA